MALQSMNNSCRCENLTDLTFLHAGLCFVQGPKGFGSKTVICSCGFLSVISDRDYFALRDLASSPVVLFGGVGRAIG